MEPVKWGVISTANIGLERVLPGMVKSPWCEIVAFGSRDLAKAEQAAKKFGAPKAYGSYAEMLADPEIEAVYNPLPNHLHVPLSIEATEAGKHVLCEKPIAIDAAEAETLIAARDRTGVLIGEAFMVRHHPQWIRAREILQSGKIGALRSVNAIFSYFNADPNNIRNMADIGGGGLYDIGVYPIVGARYLFDSEPRRVVGLIERDAKFRTDILTSAMMDFDGGQATFTCSTQLSNYQRVQILGTEGRIEIQIPYNAPPDEPTRLFVDDGSELGDASAEMEEFPICDQYMLQGEAFSLAVRNGTPLEFPLEDAVANMRVVDALFTSAREDRWVTL